ncbi:MAG: peptide deformylase [Bacteroides sp.]|nr:peptide deformylase [Bacteroidales bacterium]MCI7462946.1 peptide deformylase [Bacteroides sp.]MDD6149384.1 peptide deformylase [Bacteroides sp.]HAW06350.1 peptide deformylase [Rikenellaceae bacterium]
MIQPIYIYGSEVLRAKAEDIDLNDKEYISNLVKDLKETLAHADGCGLAAPQIGVSKRALIVDGTGMVDVYDYLKDFKRTMINPVIIEESEDENVYSEGCLSIPGIYGDVKRPASITVEYYNEDGEKVTEKFDKFACRMVQHEMSHLDGDMFVDHLAPIRKKMVAKKLLNISKGKVSAHYNTKLK